MHMKDRFQQCSNSCAVQLGLLLTFILISGDELFVVLPAARESHQFIWRDLINWQQPYQVKNYYTITEAITEIRRLFLLPIFELLSPQ